MGSVLKKVVFIQNDPIYLPAVLDKFLREFGDSTAGVNIQSIAQGKRTLLQTAVALFKLYGPRYFQWKARRLAAAHLKAKVWNGLLGKREPCYSVREAARKYRVPVLEAKDVNGEEFLDWLKENGIDLIVSISGTQFYGRQLREQVPRGIINCHGGLLPKYRGLMPSFWTLANGEREGGVTVHFVDGAIDSGPILVQRRYPIDSHDTLEAIMARSKEVAAEAIIEAVRLLEEGTPLLRPNPASEATSFSMPTPEDVRRFHRNGHRFF